MGVIGSTPEDLRRFLTYSCLRTLMDAIDVHIPRQSPEAQVALALSVLEYGKNALQREGLTMVARPASIRVTEGGL